MKRLLILAISIFLIAPQFAQACTGSINWTGAKGDGFWTTPGNWDLNRLPGMNDDVCIGGGFSVSNPDQSGVGPINSLALDGSLTLNDTGLTLNSSSATSTIKNLTLNGPNVTGGTILVVNGKAQFTGVLTLSDGGVQGPGTSTITGAVMAVKGKNARDFLVTNTVDNKGSITVTDNGVQLTLGGGSGGFTNEASASINLQGDSITILGGTTFNNSGNVVKTTGSGTSNFTQTTGTFTHNKGGAVLAQSGTLIFNALGSSSGEFGANTGATLQFANQMTLNAGTTLTGSGTLDIAVGGLWDVEAALTVDASQLAFDGQTGTIIRGNSDFTIKSGTVTWNSGVISGATTSKVTLTKAVNMQIVTAGLHGLQRNLDLFGTVNMSADLELTPSTVTIEQGATFNIKTDNGVHGQGTINNGGVFEKTAGSQTSTIDCNGSFNIVPNGTITVKSGTLDLAAGLGGALSGTMTVSAGATLEFSAGTYTLTAGTTFKGAGSTLLTVANWTLQGDAAVNTAFFGFDGFGNNAGVIGGSGKLTVTSRNFIWIGGWMQGTGSTIISAMTKLTINTGKPALIGWTVDNLGMTVITDSSSALTMGAAMWNNHKGATFDFQSDGSLLDNGNGASTFTNDGTLQKTQGGGTSNISFNGTFNHHAGATVTVDSGKLNFAAVLGGMLTGKNWTANTGATLEFSAGDYHLAAGTAFKGAGTTHLTTANWTLAGDTSIDTSIFEFDGTGFDSGTIFGSGNLTVNSANFIWTGGWMDGTGSTTLPKGTTLTITGKPALIGWTVDNFGTAAITNSNSALTVGGATWNNHAKATFDFQSDGSVQDNGNGPSTFNNDGTVQKTQGTGKSQMAFSGTFNNNGKVIAQGGGLLSLATTSGTSIGAWIAKGNSEISFDAGDWTISKGTTMTGGGTINNSATWILAAPLVVQTQRFFSFGGDVHANFSFTVESPIVTLDFADFAGGHQKNSQLPASGCSLTIPKATTRVQVEGLSLTSCTFDNFAAVQITGSSGSISLNTSSVFMNESSGKITLDMPSGGKVAAIVGDGSSTLTNSGLIKLGTDAGANTTQTISTQGTFSSSGTISVPAKRTLDLSSLTQTGGATAVAKGGTLAASGTLTISGGTIGGSGTISCPTNNSGGTIEAGNGNVTGKLALKAAETQGAGSAMTALISGTTAGMQYDQINNTSSEALNGTLNLQFGNGFTPAPTNSFDILNFSSATGNFSTVNAPAGWTAHLKLTATSLNVQFTKNGFSVSINPKAAMVKANGTTQFTGTMVGASSNGEKWSVKENGGGTVTQTGVYAAPATPGTYHVVVTSVADLTKSDTATVTVTALGADKLTVTPQAAVLQPGAVLRLQANQSVVWSVAEGRVGGSVSAGGSYTAPQKPGLYHVVASSATESSNHAVANIAVTRGKLESAYVAQPGKNAVSVLAGIAGDGLTTGPLTETESLAAGQGPVALAISPDGKLLLSANQNSNDISLFALSRRDNALGVLPGTSFAAGARPSSVAFDPTGRFVFVTNKGSDDVSVFSLDASGQLIFLRSHALAAGDKPSAIAVHPDGSVVYVTNAGTNAVQGFACDGAGMLTPLSGAPSATGNSPSAAVVDFAGKFLFVANRGSGDVSAFAIDAKNETLQEVKGSPFKTGKGAAAIAIDLTGSYLFVADHRANDIAVLQIDSETGALTLLGRTPLLNAGPGALAVDPSGQYLYVTSDKAGGVATLKLDVATGTLTPAGESTARGKASSIVLGSTTATTQGP